MADAGRRRPGRRLRPTATIAAATIAAATIVAAAAAAGIVTGGPEGILLEAPSRRPIAGALVVLYDEPGRRMVDFTYSRDDGRFAFSDAVGEGRRYFVVASRGDIALRSDPFDHRQGAPAFVELHHRDRRSGAAKVFAYLGGKLDHVVTTLVGFVLGLLPAWFEKRGEARRQLLHFRADLRGAAETLLRRSSEIEQEARAPRAGSEARLDAARAKLAQELPTIDALLGAGRLEPVLDAQPRRRRPALRAARSSLLDVSNRLSGLARLDGSTLVSAPADQVKSHLEPVETLRRALDDNLLLIG